MALTHSAPRAELALGAGTAATTLGAVDSARLLTVGAPAAVSCVFSAVEKLAEVAAMVMPVTMEDDVDDEALTVNATTMLDCSR